MKDLHTSATEARQLDEAGRLLEAKSYQEAHALCLAVLNANPGSARAYYLLGVMAADHGGHRKAIELFDRALAIDGQHSGALTQKARSLIARLERSQAVDMANRAAALQPEDPFTLVTLGVVFSRAGLHERAVPFYAAATAARPDDPAFHYNHGAALQFIGRMDEARKAYEACVALAPNNTWALSALTQIRKQTPDDNELPRLEAAFEATSADADDALRVGHALAKAHEDLGNADDALDWLKKAKAAKWAAIRYDPAADEALFATARHLAGALRGKSGQAGPAPIFIVGMPRTGTTLIDRILSSHSLVTSGGELADFGMALKRLSGTQSNKVLDQETLAAAERVDLSALGRTYAESVRSTLGLEGRFIDKLPLNILYAPAILAALPDARVICLRRHPADTVLSNYRQLFATRFPYYDYAYDLEACARYYVGFDRMVAHYSEVLPPDRFRQVRYEQVVGDIETETRALLDFCGLEFEPACVSFHENTAPVATASSAQVREPLYTRSLARWKRYEAGLKPALDILEAAGCLDPDERSPK
ncbi:MAG: sulfotransferase [Hyphomonas sp.]|uniref:tetratricopeptide repeat-containing sulfotransferase family protein n=1 Tax=Hyphomonas sp. TaxID=87 RepID=UPI003526F1C6